MKKHLSIVAAAAFALGGVSLVWAEDTAAGSNPDKDRGVTDTVRDAGAKVGIGSADQASQHQSAHAEEIHDVMAQVAEAALTKDGLDDLAERLVDADRNRLGQGQDALKSDDTLNGQIEQLQKDFQAKYNSEFDIKDEDKVYSQSFATITEGEFLGDRARTASETIKSDAGVSTDTGRTDVNVKTDTGIDRPAVNTDGQTPADTNLNDAGRNKATVRIAASHGLPAVDVPMIHEAGGWKIDLPDSVDANKFRSNIQSALSDISSKKDQWPGDVQDAFRHVTHRVLLALVDKPATEGEGMMNGSPAYPPANNAPSSPSSTPPATPSSPSSTPPATP